MRDKIDGILKSHLRSYWGIMPASDELTALMCYLEVRRWLLTMDYAGLLHYNLKSIPESEYDDIVEVFHSEYPTGMIIQAIEQVKIELK